MSSRRTTAFSGLATGMLVLAVSSIGCATIHAYQARHNYIKAQTEQHVYNMPLAQLWPNVRAMLFEQGYQTKSSDTGGSYSLETEPKSDNTYYLVVGTPVGVRACRVEFTKGIASATGNSAMRDPDIEWRLLQRVDAVRAREIERSAESEGEKAGQTQ